MSNTNQSMTALVEMMECSKDEEEQKREQHARPKPPPISVPVEEDVSVIKSFSVQLQEAYHEIDLLTDELESTQLKLKRTRQQQRAVNEELHRVQSQCEQYKEDQQELIDVATLMEEKMVRAEAALKDEVALRDGNVDALLEEYDLVTTQLEEERKANGKLKDRVTELEKQLADDNKPGGTSSTEDPDAEYFLEAIAQLQNVIETERQQMKRMKTSYQDEVKLLQKRLVMQEKRSSKSSPKKVSPPTAKTTPTPAPKPFAKSTFATNPRTCMAKLAPKTAQDSKEPPLPPPPVLGERNRKWAGPRSIPPTVLDEDVVVELPSSPVENLNGARFQIPVQPPIHPNMVL